MSLSYTNEGDKCVGQFNAPLIVFVACFLVLFVCLAFDKASRAIVVHEVELMKKRQTPKHLLCIFLYYYHFVALLLMVLIRQTPSRTIKIYNGTDDTEGPWKIIQVGFLYHRVWDDGRTEGFDECHFQDTANPQYTDGRTLYAESGGYFSDSMFFGCCLAFFLFFPFVNGFKTNVTTFFSQLFLDLAIVASLFVRGKFESTQVLLQVLANKHENQLVTVQFESWKLLYDCFLVAFYVYGCSFVAYSFFVDITERKREAEEEKEKGELKVFLLGPHV